MALKHSGFLGQSSLHDVTGSCDLCGLDADSEVSEVVALDCSFQSCPPEAAMYHQACLERFLKSFRLERCANLARGAACKGSSGRAGANLAHAGGAHPPADPDRHTASHDRRTASPAAAALPQEPKNWVSVSTRMWEGHQVPRGLSRQGRARCARALPQGLPACLDQPWRAPPAGWRAGGRAGAVGNRCGTTAPR